MNDDADKRPTAMYRIFDEAGRLLYVGISVNPARRLEEHTDKKEWGHFGEIGDVEIEWFATRRLALQAEEVAIWRENPIYNIQRALPERPLRHKRSGEVTSLAEALGQL